MVEPSRDIRMEMDPKICNTMNTEENIKHVSNTDVIAEAAPVIATKRVRSKKETPTVENQVRRSTRQSILKEGYILEPMRDNLTPKKKPRSAKPADESKDIPVTPHTPIQLLQEVGEELEIPAADLTKEKLTAHPSSDKPMNA